MSANGIVIGKVGKIIAGEQQGHFVKIVDDSENTGGFLILICEDAELRVGHDNWVEDEASLRAYFEEAGWIVEWAKDGGFDS